MNIRLHRPHLLALPTTLPLKTLALALCLLASLPLHAGETASSVQRAETIRKTLEQSLANRLSQSTAPGAEAATAGQRARLAGAWLRLSPEESKRQARAAYDDAFAALEKDAPRHPDEQQGLMAELWWRASDSRAAAAFHKRQDTRKTNSAAQSSTAAQDIRSLLATARVAPDKQTFDALEAAHTRLATLVSSAQSTLADAQLLLEVRQALQLQNSTTEPVVAAAAQKLRAFTNAKTTALSASAVAPSTASALSVASASAPAVASASAAGQPNATTAAQPAASATLAELAAALAVSALIDEAVTDSAGRPAADTLLAAWNRSADTQAATPAQMVSILDSLDAATEAAQGQRNALKPVDMTRTVQLDLGFKYYRDRSAESIVDEVVANGFDTIFIMVLGRRAGPEGFVQEAKKRGLKVWGMFMPSGIYMDRTMFPKNWRQWVMEFTADNPFGHDFISYIHDGFIAWWREHLVQMYERYPLDGMVFAEAHYPISLLNPAGLPVVADISPAFTRAFFMATGHPELPNFNNPASPLFFKKPENKALYNDLVEFRIQTLIDFYRGVWFGPEGMATRLPGIALGTWSLGINRKDALQFIREFQSHDAPVMVSRLRPDIHYFQTHAPDWQARSLPADYVRTYAPFIDPVADTWPQLHLGFQADVASTMPFRRSPEWMLEFESDALTRKIDSTTYYEFSLRDDIYSKPPQLKRAALDQEEDEIVLSFDQRIAPASTAALAGRTVAGQTIAEVIGVDGNMLRLRLSGELPTGVAIDWPISGIATDPAVRHNRPQTGPGQPNAIPAGTTVQLPLTRN